MCDKNSNVLGFIAGIVVGAAIGAGVSMLLAPRSGKETREQLKEKGEELLKKSEESFKDIKKEKVDPFIKNVQKELTEKFNEFKTKEKAKTATK
jgi:gas vesicle protein